MADYNIFLAFVSNYDFEQIAQYPKIQNYFDKALCYACSALDVSMVRFLMQHGANPVYAKDGPLYSACENGNTPVVEYLLTIPCVVQNAVANGCRSLQSAHREQFKEIMDLLLNAGLSFDDI